MRARYAAQFNKSTFSSKQYFAYLLGLRSTGHLDPSVAAVARADPAAWTDELMAGFVTSADTGNEDLVIASRAALSEHCDGSIENLDGTCAALLRNLKTRQGQDRVVVPTLEIVAFVFHASVAGRRAAVDYKKACLLVQKAAYKTGNVRKLEACVKVYGAVAGLLDHTAGPEDASAAEGAAEARRRLAALMYHPWPRIRSLVVDELWGFMALETPDVADKLKGVDWGLAQKTDVKRLVEQELHLV